MRIALIAQHFAEYAYGLAIGLADNNDVLLVLEAGNAEEEIGAVPRDSGRLSVRVLQHRARPEAAVRNAVRLVSVLDEYAPEVVHVQEVMLDAIALALPRLARYPLVVTVHDPDPHTGETLRLVQRRYRLYQREQRSRADVLITHGERLAATLREATGRDDTVRSVAHGVLGRLPGDAPPAPYAPSNQVAFLGRMHAYKGLDVFVDALDLLACDGYDIGAVVAGRGPALDQLRPRLAGRSDVQVIDRFLARSEMLQIVDESAVIAVPYRDGTQTGVGLLAIGRGRPMVASGVGSIPEVCRDGINGALVSPGDADGLARAMRSLTGDATRARQLAEGTAALAEGEFCWARIAVQTADAYELARTLHGARPSRFRLGRRP